VTRLPNVRYLTGFTGSSAQLLVTGEDSALLTDGRYTEQARREVPDLRRGTYTKEFPPALGQACRELAVRRLGFESTGVTYRLYEQLAALEGLELVPVGEEVDRLRWVKEPDELRLLEQAQALTDEAFERTLNKLEESLTERAVALELEWAMREAGAEGVAFPSIVAFGESAAEPHHRPGDRELRKGDVITLDFGALFYGYHTDMTRTVAFGEPKSELREIHDLVMRAQRAGFDAIRAGVTGADADAASRRVIEEGGQGHRFGHSLGHGVGLEVHEGPSLARRSEDELPTGSVVTVEPGVYVPGLGGVRIEDMVEVLVDGCRALPSATRELLVL
jgi:Xaa-Pro aminopeptidase